LAHVFILLILSVAAAWAVNVNRPEPLPWWADFMQQKSEKAVQAGIAILTPVEALDALKAGTHQFIDARDPDEFATGHIPNALNISADSLALGQADISSLAKDRPLIVYCGSTSCDKSDELAKALKSLGFTNISVMPEGFEGWQAANGPVEAAHSPAEPHSPADAAPHGPASAEVPNNPVEAK